MHRINVKDCMTPTVNHVTGTRKIEDEMAALVLLMQSCNSMIAESNIND